MSKKSWDFGMEVPLDKRRQDLLRETRLHDMHVPLSEEETHAKEHEALSRSADILAMAVEDFCQRQVDLLRKDGGLPDDETDVMEEDLEHHVERVAVILVREAVKRLRK